MEKTNMKYSVISHGFIPGENISIDEFERVKDDFLNSYANYNAILCNNFESFKKTWNKFEELRKTGDMLLTSMAARLIGLSKDSTFEDYLDRNRELIISQINKRIPMDVEIYVFKKGNDTMYAGKFKDHPDWIIEPVVVFE